MLKRCKPKIQLQACKGLINLYVLEASHATKITPLTSTSKGESLFVVLDASLIATTNIDCSEMIEENTVITRSLRRATLILIKLILEYFDEKLNVCHIDDDVNLKQNLTVVILHHIDSLVEWLEKHMEEKSEVLKTSSFLLTLPNFQRDGIMIHEDIKFNANQIIENDVYEALGNDVATTDSYGDEIDLKFDESTTHETAQRISKMLFNIITHTAGSVSDGMESSRGDRLEAMLPRQVMTKLIWLVAADTSSLLSFVPFATSQAVTPPASREDTTREVRKTSTANEDDADLDIDDIINIRALDDNDEI